MCVYPRLQPIQSMASDHCWALAEQQCKQAIGILSLLKYFTGIGFRAISPSHDEILIEFTYQEPPPTYY